MTARALKEANIAQVAVVRILSSGLLGCTKAKLTLDLFPFVSHRLSKGEWQRKLDNIITDLICTKDMQISPRGRYRTTSKGEKKALAFLGIPKLPTKNWKDLRNIFLVAKALGLRPQPLNTLKAINTANGLRAAVLKQHYKLPLEGDIPTVLQVRNALAVDVIQKSFSTENKNTKADIKSHIPKKLAIFLASQKLRRPRPVATTEQLLGLLAAEAVGCIQSDTNTLRLEILKKFSTLQTAPHESCIIFDHKRHRRMTISLSQPELDLHATANALNANVSSDLQSFSEYVMRQAKDYAIGWSGNKRAFISHVWKGIQTQAKDLELSEEEFKDMLSSAHRAGHITLGIADLRDKDNITDIQASVTRYKNTEWHFIRIKD
ncbi:MAG: hypothetical protein AAF228_09360 [Pseudomonadota bacterium]